MRSFIASDRRGILNIMSFFKVRSEIQDKISGP